MTTGKALNGKPYAGNPHVRFDEGEVAPAATPRRGSLLYKAIVQRIALAVAIFVTGASAFAADWMDANDPTITYTALKTIKGDGSAYVITDIVPTLTDVVKMRFKTRNATLNANETLFCARQGFKNKSFGAMIANSGKLRIDRGDQAEQLSSSALTMNTEYLMTVNYGDGNKNTTVKMGSLNFALANNLGATSDSPTSGLVLFALNDNQSVLSGFRGQHYLYYFELYDSSGNLKNCLMPAQCDSDSEVGLYDTKSGKFYPQAGDGTFTTAERTVTGQGAKWIGRGGDNKMSTAANWEGGNVPQEGDDLDFTLAPPLAELVADINATFGKVWLSDGDIPGFTGALAARAVNNLPKMQTYDAGANDFSFTLAAPTGAEFIWNSAGTNWGDADAWTYDNASATWSDHNNAIFNIANATATLADNAIASSVVFRADATIAAGGGMLAVPKIVVSNGVSAVVNAPIDGMFVKSGAGTLTLGASRAATTHILEGTFKMAPGATLSTSYQLQLGTDDPSRPVTFDYGGQTYTKDMEYYLVTGSSVTLTNGVYVSEHSSKVGMRISEETVIPSSLVILDSVVRVGDKDFNFGYGTTLSGDSLPDEPKSILAATNTIFNEVGAFRIGRDGVTEGKTAGFYKADFENCAITTAYFVVNNDRPLNNARLNNVRLVATSVNSTIIARDGDAKWITVGPDGLTLDTLASGWKLNVNLGGYGVVTKVGSGVLAIYTNQTATAALNVNEGSIVPQPGVSVARSVAVASGATLGVYGSQQASFANVAFASGSTLNILNYYFGVTPVSFGALTFPEENGAVVLKLDGGAFPKGVYAIYERNGVTAAEGEKFAVETADDLAYTWSVVDDRLLLTVGELSGNFWTGLGDGVSMSDGANWLNGAPAAGADIDFTGVAFNRTINADAGVTYGRVTMGPGVVMFTNALSATSFNDTSKIAVDANSTVTIDGDLEFSGSADEYIVNYVAVGGRFVVSGDIKAMPGKNGFVYPCVNYNQFKGTIVAKGLVNNSVSTRVNRFALTRGYANTQVNWAVGEHGISGTDGFWKPNGGTIQSTITAEADFRISSEIAILGPLTLDTKTHTIEITGDTARRGICGYTANTSASSGAVTIIGAGRVVVDYDVNNLTSEAAEKSNPFTVLDTATLALKPGSNIGTGQVSVTNGATLAICESGTVTLNGGLTLDDGATLAFNFTESANPPVLALATGKSVIFTSGASTNIAVKVSGAHPRGGEKILTTCGGFNTDGVNVSLAEDVPNWVNGLSVNGDGNIVLDVKSAGMMIIVK